MSVRIIKMKAFKSGLLVLAAVLLFSAYFYSETYSIDLKDIAKEGINS